MNLRSIKSIKGGIAYMTKDYQSMLQLYKKVIVKPFPNSLSLQLFQFFMYNLRSVIGLVRFKVKGPQSSIIFIECKPSIKYHNLDYTKQILNKSHIRKGKNSNYLETSVH